MTADVRRASLYLAIAWGNHIADIYRRKEDKTITCIQDLPEWATFEEAIKELEGEAK